MFKTFEGSIEAGCILVVFGGTGDLTMRKLIPAVYNLSIKKALTSFALVLIGRRGKNEQEFIADIRESLVQYATSFDEKQFHNFIRIVFYNKFDFVNQDEGYWELKKYLLDIDKRFGTNGNRLFYLAVAPEHFAVILEKLDSNEMLVQNESYQRVLVEKPFGYDLKTAKQLNDKMVSLAGEENIFRIDHYLGKEMVQNIVAVRFGNIIFETIWNSRYIDNIQITISEQLGVGTRAGYFEKAGVLKDMLQNHLLQMLAIIAMEPPQSLNAEDMKSEKVKILKHLRLFNKNIAEYIIRGQYGPGAISGKSVKGYREEDKVNPDSGIETFLALKAYVDNERWRGVPFYIRSGKRLKDKKVEIVVQFKNTTGLNLYGQNKAPQPNLLVFTVQPMEGFHFRINAKTPGENFTLETVSMDYCQSCRTDVNSPEAYETILLDAMRDNSTFFISWDELEYSWRFIESIENVLKLNCAATIEYAAGTDGPIEAQELLSRDGRHWWETKHLQ